MELPQAWKLWADEVEANNLALHNQLDWMWVVIALLCLIMVALVAWLRRTHALHLKTLGERVTEHSVHDQLAVHCKQLEEELVRLGAEVDRLKRENADLLSEGPTHDVSREALPKLPIKLDHEEPPSVQLEKAIADIQRFKTLVHAYRVIVLYSQQTGTIAESLMHGMVIDGPSLYVCSSLALVRRLGREEIIEKGKVGEMGVARFLLTFREGKLVEIRPVTPQACA